MTSIPILFRLRATLLGFALLTQLTSLSQARTSVAATWLYYTARTPDQDYGAFNSKAFYNYDMSTDAGSFDKSGPNGTISISASQGEIHLLNTFSIDAGRFGRFQSSSNVDSQAGGGFEDTLTITDSARTGQRGFYTGAIMVDLNFGVIGSTGNENIFGVGVGSNLGNARFASQNSFYNNGGISTYAYLGFTASNPQSYDHQLLTFSVPFTFGEAFGISVWMESTIGTSGYTSEARMLTHDASHTVNWAGTLLVEDAARNDLAPDSYTLSSGSGTNYAGAVPEPGSMLMIAAGVGMCGLLRFRRR